MEVRRGRPADWPQVAGLLAQLDRPDLADPDRSERFRSAYVDYLERSDAVVLVAETDGELVGVLNLEVRQRFTHTRPYGWIPNVVTASGRRGAGVGSELVDAAEREARARGCTQLTGESAIERTEAHEFFRRRGFRERGIAIAKWLD